MKKSPFLLCAVLFCLATVSCTKESETPADAFYDITGTWKLVNMQVQTNVTNQLAAGSDVSKTITTSNYTTQNNSGTITITESTIAGNNLSYTINTVANASFYENGTLTGTYSQPMQSTIQAYSSTSAYTRVNADSLYFQSGSFNLGNTEQTSLPGGSKIKLEQDKLYLMQSGMQTTTETVQGQTVSSIVQAATTVTLQRQ